MYYIKEINIDNYNNTIEIINGIKTYKIDKMFVVVDDFWGKTEIMLGDYADRDLITKKGETHLIPYANEYTIKELDDGYKHIILNVSTPQEKIDGYIVIIKYATNIKTDGEVLFRRYPTEVVTVLKEGNYLELFDRKIEVINNKLCLIM